MYRFVILIVAVLTVSSLRAQHDTVMMVKYTPEFRFQDGVFLSFESVKKNSPIKPERIQTNLKQDDLKFYEKIFEAEEFVYFDDYGIKQETKVAELWGYANMGVLFIYYNDETNRVPIVGSICHFVSNYTYQTQRNYDPFYNPYRVYDPYSYNYRTQPVTTREMRQYLLDWETGKVFTYNRESVGIILMKDPVLYEEYNALKKSRQKKMMFFYMRRFNENNPIYIPLQL